MLVAKRGNLEIWKSRSSGILDIWDFSETVKMTASWYNCYLDEELVISSGQLEKYINDAKVIGADFANYD